MKTILVIEDKTEVRENVVEMLKLAQYAVVAAADGKKGVELARSAEPDLILCDIMMPELDGYGVLYMLSKDPATATIPFIFLTAKVDPVHFRSGMNLGADDYLTKPVDDITLLNAVEVRLKKNEQTRRKVDLAGLTTLLTALRHTDNAGHHLSTGYPTIHYSRKQLLFAEGNLPSALFFVRRGQLKRFRTDTLGNTLITALVGSGDFVGLSALLPDRPYAESAEVLADTEICAIPKAEFAALLQQHPDIAPYFMELLAAEVAERDEWLLKLAYQSVRKRVAEALLLVYRKFYRLPTGGPDAQVGPRQSPQMTLSRENWANLVGASIETVIRVLSDLRQEGLIELTGSQITILDLDRLARLKH